MSSNKYLIVGLGNPGAEYVYTRHNAGFRVLDKLAENLGTTFAPNRYGDTAEARLKNKQLLLLKPSTMMNLSGNAVRYWLQKENIPVENLLVVVDELALPFGTLRMRAKGSDGGHNGLKHIQQTIGTQAYARLRFGIGHHFSRGEQIAYVLDPFTDEEEAEMDALCQQAVEGVRDFCLIGVERAMNIHNTKQHHD